MKARVKATGALLIVRPYDGSDFGDFDWICDMIGETASLWKTEELDFIDDYEPDYWEKLKHQYIGMILSATYSSPMFQNTPKEDLYKNAIFMARELVDKLKEEEK